jgi:hypothetical protein
MPEEQDEPDYSVISDSPSVCSPPLKRPRKAAKPSCKWTCGEVEDKLSVKYLPAPWPNDGHDVHHDHHSLLFHALLRGTSSHDAYLNLLHGPPEVGAQISLPVKQTVSDGIDPGILTSKKLERFQNFIKILEPLDTNVDAALPALLRDIPPSERGLIPGDVPVTKEVSDAMDEVKNIDRALEECFIKLTAEERMLPELLTDYRAEVVFMQARRYV